MRSSPLLRAVLAVAHRDALVYLSYRLRSIGQLVAVFFTLALFFYFSRIVSTERFASPQEYFASVVVGLAIVEVLTATLTTLPTGLRSELQTGTFERLVVSPLGPVMGIVAMAVFPLVTALVVGIALIVLAAIAFGLPLAATAPLALPAAVLGAAAFIPIAFAFCAAVLVVKQAGSGATFVVTGMSLLSGAFFPRDLLPSWISWAADVVPLTPALELMRHLLVDTPTTIGVLGCVVRLLVFAIVGIPLGLAAVAAGVEVCRQRATLTEH